MKKSSHGSELAPVAVPTEIIEYAELKERVERASHEEMARRIAAAIISVEEGCPMHSAYKRIKEEVLKPDWIECCKITYERGVVSCVGDPFFEHKAEFWNPRIIIGAEEKNAAAKDILFLNERKGVN